MFGVDYSSGMSWLDISWDVAGEFFRGGMSASFMGLLNLAMPVLSQSCIQPFFARQGVRDEKAVEIR